MPERVMLINPSNTMPIDSVRRLAPPLGLLYLAASIKDNYNVSILDSTCEGYYNTLKTENGYISYGLSDKDIKRRIEYFNPDVVGITSMFSAHQDNAIHHADLVKEVDKNITTVLGGIHPSLFPLETIKHNSVDFVVIGEGDFRFKKLLDGEPLKDGFAWKEGRSIKIEPMVTRIEDLDSIPFPARDLIDIEKYIKIGVPYAPFPIKERTEQVQTSRGCPFNCIFCSTVKYWGRQFRMRSVENILREIDLIIDKYHIEEIQFTDDNMTINKKRATELFKELKKRDIVWCPPHGLMANTLDPPMIKLMAESGAYQLTIAIESGSDRVRKEIIRKTVPSKEKMTAIVKEAHKYNVQIHGLFILGFPGESRDEMNLTLKYPYEVGFDSVSFFVANPMPGSDLYTICKEKGYLPKNPMMNVKTAEMNIPKNSPDYVMSNQELNDLVDQETRKYNEYIKEKYPGVWERKYAQFLKKHGDKADMILGRVT